jgi:hypothetical protein
LKQEQKRNMLSVEDQLIIKLELLDIVDEWSFLQYAVPQTKALQS